MGSRRSDFLLPAWGNTFSASAARHTRRGRAQRLADFNALEGEPADDTIFLGGQDCLPLLLRLTASRPGCVLHR